jgi:hypothetical protein
VRRQAVDAEVVGLQQGQGLLGRQGLDPERSRERDQRLVDLVPPQLLAAPSDVGGREGEDAVGFAADPERPAAVGRISIGGCRRRASSAIRGSESRCW